MTRRLLVSGFTALVVVVPLSGASAVDKPRTWNLAADFRTSPNQANPNPDSFGIAAVWYFMEGPALHEPSSYRLLQEFITNAYDVPGLEQWQGPFESIGPTDKLPAVGVNATGMDQFPFGIAWRAGAIRVHPWPGDAAVVGWRNPGENKRFSVTGSFIDIHADCGDGISWFIDQGAATLASGSFPNGGQQSFAVATKVPAGGFLYFIVDAGPSFDHRCDSTQLNVTIRGS